MSDEGGGEMACSRTSPAAEPLDDEDLLAEILLRLPSHHSSLLCASLVCKRWRSIATHAAFRHRFSMHHRNAVFEECPRELKFTPLLDPPDHIPSERFSLDLSADKICSWSVLGCRHGRVLLLNLSANMLLVFEPTSRDTHRILVPPEFALQVNAAVLCAAGDGQYHVHGDCHSRPFKVVVVGIRRHDAAAIARVYSQETGMWGDLASTRKPCAGVDLVLMGRPHPSTLIGNALYWRLTGYEDVILKFDLDNQSLTVIDWPPIDLIGQQRRIIRAEDGGLGLVILAYPRFQLWEHKVDSHGVSTWVQQKNVNMYEVLGLKAYYAHITGYAEDADAIFLTCDPWRPVPVIIHLKSMKAEKHGVLLFKDYHPFTNFYTAERGVLHQPSGHRAWLVQ
ncbi:unnamed protein product [Alopecurus aequalis]